MKMMIGIPNDFGSTPFEDMAIAACYGGDREAAADDNGEAMYETLAGVAKAAGLAWCASSDFGSVWDGTAEQCADALVNLPPWATTNMARE